MLVISFYLKAYTISYLNISAARFLNSAFSKALFASWMNYDLLPCLINILAVSFQILSFDCCVYNSSMNNLEAKCSWISEFKCGSIVY